MARKTLKQKLRSQLRSVKQAAHIMLNEQHHLAGVTINYEQGKLQAVAMAHGVMVTLLSLHKLITDAGFNPDEDKTYLELQTISRGRIAQCVEKLVAMGVPIDEANAAIGRGY